VPAEGHEPEGIQEMDTITDMAVTAAGPPSPTPAMVSRCIKEWQHKTRKKPWQDFLPACTPSFWRLTFGEHATVAHASAKDASARNERDAIW